MVGLYEGSTAQWTLYYFSFTINNETRSLINLENADEEQCLRPRQVIYCKQLKALYKKSRSPNEVNIKKNQLVYFSPYVSKETHEDWKGCWDIGCPGVGKYTDVLKQTPTCLISSRTHLASGRWTAGRSYTVAFVLPLILGNGNLRVLWGLGGNGSASPLHWRCWFLNGFWGSQ